LFSPQHYREELVSNMKKKVSKKKSNVASAPKKRRVAQPRLIRRERKDLQLKNYLMEDHPELGLPVENGMSAKAARVSQPARK
jgi:hypothetical protein